MSRKIPTVSTPPALARSTRANAIAFWESSPLPSMGRMALLGAVATALAVEVVFWISEGSLGPAAFVDAGTLLAIALFAWRPPVAAVSLILGGQVALATGTGAPYALATAIATGLVLATCSAGMSAAYAAVTIALTFAASWAAQGLSPAGGFATLAVALASGLVGGAFRRIRRRERALETDVDELQRRTAVALQEERDRIADELHNTIAHDLTVVVMHARALERQADADSREISVQAIVSSATQALTDMRRMLRAVHVGSGEIETSQHEEDQTLISALTAISRQLEALGISVTTDLPPREPEISNTISVTMAHVAREAATNVLKHARHALSARISLTQTDSTVTLSIWNDKPRVQRAPEDAPSGYGLRRMEDRVALLGGAFSAGPVASGWQVDCSLPLT